MTKKEIMQKGITLVALVITVIVLLILAGITISLVLGDNGILNRAKQSEEKYIKAQIKEEIELGITDIQMELTGKSPIENLSKEAIKNNLQNKVKEIITIEDNLTGEYKGYEYWIDDNYQVHIGDKTNATMKIQASATPGTSSISVVANATSSNGNIIGYRYIVDGVESELKTENTYQIENLEAESTHTIKVIAMNDKGNKKESQTLTVKTEPRTYLYKEGNEYTDITDGWTINRYCSKYEDKFYYASIQDTGWNGAKANKLIDLTDYKKVCMLLNSENTAYIGLRVNEAPFSLGGITSGADTGMATLTIPNGQGNQYVWFYSVAKGARMSINSVWLEK